MLRRNSSRSKHKRPLGRSKSTTSVPRSPVRRLVSIEPAAAERDAYIAATLSYHWAHGHSNDMSPTPRGSRVSAASTDNGSLRERGSTSFPDATRSHQDSPTKCALARQHSVRFAGPNARPRRALAPRANEASLFPANKRPDAVRELSVGLGQLGYPDNGRHLEVNDATRSLEHVSLLSDEVFFIGSHAGTTVPSLGRLRKSRSTLTYPVPPSPKFGLSESPAERLKDWLSNPIHGAEDKENEPAGFARPFALRAPRSMSFLRGHDGHGHASTSGHKDTSLSFHDDVHHLHDVEPCRLPKSQPSVFFRPKHRRCGSPAGLPKSLRNSSNGSAALSSAFSGSSIPISKRAGLRFKARKVSSSLKSKFKGLFRPRSANDAIGGTLHLPPSSGSDSGASCQPMDGTPEPEEASVSRVPSHVPSLHAVPSNQQLRSRQGSLESLRLEQNLSSDEKSRVTSWTNSSAHTVASVATHADWERQRLSVIKENGTHVSAGTAARPMNLVAGMEPLPSSLSPCTTIDSQRVYAALMKRLDETRQKTGTEPETRSLAPSLDSLVEQFGSQAQAQEPPTIRCVQAEDDVFHDRASKSLLQVADAPLAADERQSTKQSGSGRSAPYQAYPKPTPGDGRGLSPQSKLRPGADTQKSLAHRSSAFFASPTNHLFRTASPYRRALRESIQEAQESECVHALDSRYLSTLSALSLPTRRPSTAGSDRDVWTSDAGSVYSSTSECAQAGQPENTADAGQCTCTSPNDHGRAGEKSLVDAAAFHAPVRAHGRNVSSASSVEWKTWLSANVSKFETPSTSMSADSRGELCHGTGPSFGHVREEAEIDSPGDLPRPDMFRPADPERATRTKQSSRRGFQASPGTGLRRTMDARHDHPSPADENSPPVAGQRRRSPGLSGPPIIPSRSSLRVAPSLPGAMSGAETEAERQVAKLPRMRSLNTVAHRGSTARDDSVLRRRGRACMGFGGISPAQSSPGLTAAVEKQFGKLRNGSPKGGHERKVVEDVTTPKRVADGGDDAGSAGSKWDAQVMGSRRIVDLFLSSRRRRIESSATETESDSTSLVFL